MRILMLGLNHRTAPLEVREKVALAGETLDTAITRLRSLYPKTELVILSTCNRTELYVARPSHEAPDAQHLLDFLAEYRGIDKTTLTAACIHRENEEAIAQLFRVATGLESMVLGEAQILGQVKRGYERAVQLNAVGPVLHKVFQQAIGLAKETRTRTGIDQGRLSIGSVAVDFARQIFDRFDDKTVVGIGAGEMAKLTLRHLQSLQPARLWLTNRSTDRAQALATRLGLADARGGVRPFADLDNLLIEADIVLTSTASPVPIITAERFKPLLKHRRFRPLYLIDIAVPRDVAPEVGTLTNVYLYNIDDLQEIVTHTMQERQGQIDACNALLRDAVKACLSEVQNRDISQLIKALRDRLHEIGAAEQDRTLRKLAALPPDQLAAAAPELLQEHTHRVINKILHVPLSHLDRRRTDAPLAFYAAALRRLFALEDAPPTPTDKLIPSGPDKAADEKNPTL